MGKTLLPLVSTNIPAKTIFDRRFVLECCETFHLHWRNLRLELTHENFLDFVKTIDKALQTWRDAGSPPATPHFEMGRLEIQHPICTPEDFKIEVCENLYRTHETSKDSHFLDEESFVHMHYRDLRVEMSNADFDRFASHVRTAHERFRAHALHTVDELLEMLAENNILYVVLRNWENLPDQIEVGPHSDLDLLVHPLHVAKVDELWNSVRTQPEPYRVQRKVPVAQAKGDESFILVDLRTTDDGYFPESLAQRLLTSRVRHKNFFVLPPQEYFLSLLYHVVHHKGVLTADYSEKLSLLASAAALPFTESDARSFAACVRMLSEHVPLPAQPNDRSVLPKLPLLYPLETVRSSRFLAAHDGVAYQSRVYLVNEGELRRVVKQATADVAMRELQVLSRLSDPRFPKASNGQVHGAYSTCELEYVDGYLLSDLERFYGENDSMSVRRFMGECLEILTVLQEKGIVHRDVRAENIMVRHGHPVLLDFGWAVAEDLPCFTPEGLGNDGRPPEGGFDDRYAMGKVFEKLCLLFPEFAHVADAMTRTNPAERVRERYVLNELFEQDAPFHQHKQSSLRASEYHAAKGRLETALAILNRLLEANPQQADVLMARAAIKTAQGLHEEAQADVAHALQIDPHSLITRRRSTDKNIAAEEDLSSNKEEIQTGEPGADASTETHPVKRIAVVTPTPTVSPRQPAIASNVPAPVVIERQADVAPVLRNVDRLVEEGKIDEAIAELESGFTAFRGAAKLHFRLYELLKVQGKSDDAEREFSRAFQYDPSLAEIHNEYGVRAFESGNVSLAIKNFERAVRLDATCAAARKNLSELYAQEGRMEDAARHLKAVLEYAPNDVEALMALGSIAITLGSLGDALFLFKHVLAISPENTDAAEVVRLLEEKGVQTDKAPATIMRLAKNESVQEQQHAGILSFPKQSRTGSEYEQKLRAEIAQYAGQINVHDLPPINHVVNARFLSSWLHELTGESKLLDWWAKEIDALLQTGAGDIHILSIGCGNGDVELNLLEKISDNSRVHLLGLDVNSTMISRANQMARERKLRRALFDVQDLNSVKLDRDFDVFIASHSLHHIVELENLFAAIEQHSSVRMIFLINDMIGRNGHVMWPAAESVVRRIWASLDERYRYNAYWKTIDRDPMNVDCSHDGFEGVRAQDILPLMLERFDVELFLPFAGMSNRFTDRGYGHNYQPERAEDVALMMRILALDVKLVHEKRLSPVQAFVKLKHKGTVEVMKYFFQTPEETIANRLAGIESADYDWNPTVDIAPPTPHVLYAERAAAAERDLQESVG